MYWAKLPLTLIQTRVMQFMSVNTEGLKANN